MDLAGEGFRELKCSNDHISEEHMDLKELETWIETAEGKTWADGLKKPLLDKRDELLTKVRELNESHTQTVSQVNDLTETLAKERTDSRRELIDRELSGFVDQHVVPGLREGAKALFTGLDIEVKADGQQRVPHVSKENLKGLPIEGEVPDGLPLREYLETWAKTDEAKDYLKGSGSTGGGAHGSTYHGPTSTQEEDAFTAAVLAKM